MGGNWMTVFPFDSNTERAAGAGGMNIAGAGDCETSGAVKALAADAALTLQAAGAPSGAIKGSAATALAGVASPAGAKGSAAGAVVIASWPKAGPQMNAAAEAASWSLTFIQTSPGSTGWPRNVARR